MQRFKPGDAVFILPRFSHLYPANSAVVIGVTPDPFRPMFNEYTIEFADRSTTHLMEFQIIEDLPHYDTFIAVLTYDSQHHVATAETRGGGHASSRRIIFQTPQFDMDVRIRTTQSCTSIMGQMLERSTKDLLSNMEVHLIKDSMPITTALSDSLGMFNLIHVPRGSLNIIVVIPHRLLRIVGEFAV
jgi:hypothetical protein